MASVENNRYDPTDMNVGNAASSLFGILTEHRQVSGSRLPPIHTGQRSKMTRGCRFQDFDEAHRNIRGQRISNSCSNSLSQSSSDSSESQDHTSSGAGSIAYSDEVASQDIFDSSRSLVSDDDEGDPIYGLDAASASAPTGLASADVSSGLPETPDSMVKRIYKLYQSHMDLNPADNDKVEMGAPGNQGKLRDGATTRLGFRPDDAGQSIPGNAKGNLFASEVEIAVDDGGAEDEYQPRDLAAITCESILYPMPLRVQSIRGENKRTSYRSGTAVSADGMTEDSDDDPFRYDKNPYNIFLQPSKEREVSAALKHIGSLNSHSRATLYSCDEGTTPAACQASLRPPPIPQEYRVDSTLGDRHGRELTPEDADEFYDTSIVQPNWEVERGTYEVRVVLKDEEAPRPPEKHSAKSGGSGKHRPEGKKAINVDLYYDVGKENTSGERDEWETVVTSAAGIGSIGQPFPPATSVGPRNSAGFHDFKVTGSSLADVSDESSFGDIPFDEYASTDRIVQPSSGQEGRSEESLRIRDVNGSKIPVIVPKQRVHRVNGLAQDPSPRFSQAQRSGSETTAALGRAVPNPFRRLSTRRAHAFSSIPLQVMQSKSERSRSRFDFRVSQASDCEGLCAPEDESRGAAAETERLETGSNNVPGAHADTGLRESGSSQSSSDTIHSFPFSLIPLPEAARLQAIKRTQELPVYGTAGASGRAPVLKSSHARIPAPTPAYRWKQQHTSQRHAVPRDSTNASNTDSTVPDTSWETVTPFGSTRSASRVLKSAATRLRLDNIVYRFEQRQQRPAPERRSSTPRLYPWDYQSSQQRGQVQWHGQPPQPQPQPKRQGTDPELREIAAHASADADYLERTGVPLDPEAFLTEDARQRRRAWFAYMMAISVLLPFLSVAVYMGRFDCGLSWYTRGEVARLNLRQRRVILATMVLQFMLWPSVLIYVIWQLQQKQ